MEKANLYCNCNDLVESSITKYIVNATLNINGVEMESSITFSSDLFQNPSIKDFEIAIEKMLKEQ